MIKVFKTQVFQFHFQPVESKFMGERGIEITGLLTDFLRASTALVSRICRMTFTRSAIMIRMTRISSEKEIRRLRKVITFDHGIPFIKIVDPGESSDNMCRTVAILLAHLLKGIIAIDHSP
jgi:hypothetical protein